MRKLLEMAKNSVKVVQSSPWKRYNFVSEVVYDGSRASVAGDGYKAPISSEITGLDLELVGTLLSRKRLIVPIFTHKGFTASLIHCDNLAEVLVVDADQPPEHLPELKLLSFDVSEIVGRYAKPTVRLEFTRSDEPAEVTVLNRTQEQRFQPRLETVRTAFYPAELLPVLTGHRP